VKAKAAKNFCISENAEASTKSGIKEESDSAPKYDLKERAEAATSPDSKERAKAILKPHIKNAENISRKTSGHQEMEAPARPESKTRRAKNSSKEMTSSFTAGEVNAGLKTRADKNSETTRDRSSSGPESQLHKTKSLSEEMTSSFTAGEVNAGPEISAAENSEITRDRSSSAPENQTHKTGNSFPDGQTGSKQSPRNLKFVSNKIKFCLKERDGHRCEWMDAFGQRCECESFLEIDHEVPRAWKGGNEIYNLRVLCRQHNSLEALLRNLGF